MKRLGVAILGSLFACQVPHAPPGDEEPSIETASITLSESLHDVAVRIDRHETVFHVRREWTNRGRAPHEIESDILLPAGGTLSNLHVRSGDDSFEVDLMETELASEKFAAMLEETEADSGADGAPAVLVSWTARGTLALESLPVAPGRSVEVSYDVHAPTCFRNGKWSVDYPQAEDGATPELEVESASDLSATNPRRAEVNETIGCGDDDELGESDRHWMLGAEGRASRFDYRFGRAQLDGRSVLEELSFQTPQELAPRPPSPQLLFVVDGSYSVDDPGFSDQFAVIQAIAKATPGSMSEVIIFRRDAERVVGSFVSARTLESTLESLSEDRRLRANGSNLSAGLDLAVQLAAGRSAVRIIVLTDGNLPDAEFVAPEFSRFASLSPDAAVHLALRDGAGYGGAIELIHETDSTLGDVVLEGRGTFVMLDGDPSKDPTTALEHFVRPTRIDAVELIDLNASEEESDPWFLSDGLGAGESLREISLRTLQSVEARPALRGQIWGKTTTWPLHFDLEETSVIRHGLGSEVGGDLDVEVETALAHRVLAVTEHVSALAVPSDPHPVPGLFDVMLTGRGIGGFSISSGCGGGRGYRAPSLIQPLRELLLEAAADCGDRSAVAGATFEITDREIANVEVDASSGGHAICVEERLWAHHLDARFENRSTTVSIRVETARE